LEKIKEEIMSSELVVALVTAVLSSIIGPIAVYYVQQLTEKKKKDLLGESMETNELIIGKMESIREDYKSDRVWLLQFHNGGHFYPTGKSIQKFSMVYEVMGNSVVPCQHQFQNIPVSLFSKGINLLHKGNVICIPDTTQGDKQYEGITSVVPGASVKSTYLFPLFNIKNEFIGVVGMDFTEQQIDLDVSQLTDIEVESSTIGGVLHNYLTL
jgi:hypothetical protein